MGCSWAKRGSQPTNHFLLPPQSGTFQFKEGQYRLDVFARLLGDDKAKLLFTQRLTISREIATSLEEPATGVYFDWGPDSARYLPHVDKWEPSPDSGDLPAPGDPPQVT